MWNESVCRFQGCVRGVEWAHVEALPSLSKPNIQREISTTRADVGASAEQRKRVITK